MRNASWLISVPYRSSAWTPHQPPLSAVHGSRCVWYPLRVGSHTSEMCLRGRHDRLSLAIASQGTWAECDGLAELWNRRSTGGPANASDVFIDVGANLGACTLHLLMKSSARAIVFEPSPANLFHLTESLHRAARDERAQRNRIKRSERLPLSERIVVLPFAAGDAFASLTLFAAQGNAGNSVLGVPIADHDGQDMTNETCACAAKALTSLVERGPELS